MKYVKCVVWDLDNTLWDGTLLEGDAVSLKPGIKEILKTLDERGILNSIASKNDLSDVMQKLEEFEIAHYFLVPQVGWGAKSTAIARIAEQININRDTLVFIDDQPFERDEVASVYPEVMIVDAIDYKELINMERLNPKVITEDSKRRRQMYLEQEKRVYDETHYEGTSIEFLESLNMEIRISRAQEYDLKRAEELTIRTNQLNSTGIQYGYDELKELLDVPSYDVWVCELTDKYGSYGKIGLVLVEHIDNRSIIRLLLMSCRTVSRGVGTVLLSFLMKRAKSAQEVLQADFIRTDRNRQMLITYQLANFVQKKKEDKRILFENDLSIIQEYPPYIKIIVDDERKK
ncbi:HAD-IIIC family phosphatase [Cellulosilyticum ruminicola]|uniref:HAD-IIIC family phosphatase n=1 Tax=Cellulosilyticum ruminicola TaxID=425254 RepID=UPI0006CF3537|nr:HAD-IIIC family phosphatase [Cellulosilyticum ruminicola]